MAWSEEQMAARAAQEIEAGSIVNLGIGIPTLVANYLPARKDIWLHTENGILGMGPFPVDGKEDPHVINAGKQTVTILPGGACFDSNTSFAMIRGGHIDLTILGAMQVSEHGDLANWSIPGGKTMGFGGAMDLAAGSKRVLVMTTHRTKKGEPKLVPTCTYPLTARRVVQRIITDLAVIDATPQGFVLVECAPGTTATEVRAATGTVVR